MNDLKYGNPLIRHITPSSPIGFPLISYRFYMVHITDNNFTTKTSNSIMPDLEIFNILKGT